MKCKTSDWACLYHACMSDDCQKRHVLKNGINWGNGNCKTKINHENNNHNSADNADLLSVSTDHHERVEG